MEEKIITLPTFTISVNQSAKGFWYCTECKIRGDNIADVETHLKEAVEIAKKKVEELNTDTP